MTSLTKRTLKDLPSKILVSKVSYRLELLKDLQSVVKNNDDPEISSDIICKAIAKVIPSALSRYNDAKSRNAVTELIKAMLEASKSSGASLIASVAESMVSMTSANFVPSKPNAKTALAALIWTQIVAGSVSSTADFKRFITIQAACCSLILSSKDAKLTAKTNKVLQSTWAQLKDLDAYIQAVQVEGAQPLVLSSVLGVWLAKTGHPKAEEFKKSVLEKVVSTFIQSKTKVRPNLIEAMSSMLKTVTHDEFKSLLLPAILKAMLRNPEIVMEVVAVLLANLSIDLSQYVEQVSFSYTGIFKFFLIFHIFHIFLIFSHFSHFFSFFHFFIFTISYFLFTSWPNQSELNCIPTMIKPGMRLKWVSKPWPNNVQTHLPSKL